MVWMKQNFSAYCVTLVSAAYLCSDNVSIVCVAVAKFCAVFVACCCVQ